MSQYLYQTAFDIELEYNWNQKRKPFGGKNSTVYF